MIRARMEELRRERREVPHPKPAVIQHGG
jgi:hypothetical protein